MGLRILQRDLLDDLEIVRAEGARRKFSKFVKMAWPLIDPAPLVWNWHLDAICDHLQAVSDGIIQRLIINVPPGHAKSAIVSVLWPAWRWILEPQLQLLTASYEGTLATRDAVKSRTLIDHPWYQRHYVRKMWKLASDQNVKSYYTNTKAGFRLCLSVGGKGTGWRGDGLIIDDPINVNDSHSKVAREEVIRWKTETMATRFNDLDKSFEVLIMQRVHEEDLSGYLLETGDWEHLRLPSEFETDGGCRCASCKRGKTRIGWKDPRTKEGELLFPAKFSQTALANLKKPGVLGPLAYAGQHQQRPAPPGGNLIKREWLQKRWARSGTPSENLIVYSPEDQDVSRARFIVTDAAFKAHEEADKVAIQVVDIIGPNLFLIDMRWGNMGFIETSAAITDLYRKWPNVQAIRIEDKANGSAIIETLKLKLPGVQPIEPEGSKEARVSAAAEFICAGNVILPADHPQTEDLVAEALSFPKGRRDDGIDCLAYGVLLGLMRNDATWLEGLVRR